MKELHNHIFSNTTCISKEIMLKYINKQLSKKELYEVEKHMLDCELCSDAYEGMKMATNSSMLFAIDNAIDLRAGSGTKKSPIMRNLMVAASLLVIVFGAYFTVNNFNQHIETAGLAVNEEAPNKMKPIVPENFINQKTLVEEDLQKGTINEYTTSNHQDETEIIMREQNVPQTKIVAPSSITILNDELEQVEDEEILEDEANEVDFITTNTAGIETVNERHDNNLIDDDNRNVSGASGAVARTLDDSENKELRKSKDKKKSENRPLRNAKASFAETEPAIEEKDIVIEANTYDLYSYKVYDYAPEYQNEYEFDKSGENEIVSSDFENKNDKVSANKELEELTIEVTYKQTLESAIKALKENKFKTALTQFDLILKTHPKDVNALFYSGITLYNLNQFTTAKVRFDSVLNNEQTIFIQEAKWYKAKSWIELGDLKKAKKCLQEIIDANGFYKTQAQEKLQEL